MVIPSGGASVSASTGAQSSAVTVTIPQGAYYMTEAGGVDSLVDELEAQLNENVRPFPTNASSLAAALGYGTWTSGAGWLMQEASGSLAAEFGAPSLSAVSTPTYRNSFTTGKYAIGFDSVADAFSGGDVFDVTGTDDLILAWVGAATSVPSSDRDLIAKYTGGVGYLTYIVGGGVGGVAFYVNDGTGLVGSATSSLASGEWHVGIAVVERATNRVRVGIRTLGGTTYLGSEGDITGKGTFANAASLLVGANGVTGNGPHTGMAIAATYIVSGSGVATGLSTNLSTALTDFANTINAAWSVSMSSTTGLITASNSFWPSSISFTSTALRDVLGFEYDFDYPQTNAQLGVALGQTSPQWEAGWLCNESSGDLAAVFGSTALADASTPTYSNYGPRGGNDRAVGFNTNTDQFAAASTSTFDVGASEDLALLLVVNFSTISGNVDIVGKGWPGSAGYLLARENGIVQLYVKDGVDQVSVSAAVAANTWYAILGVLERATNTIRVGVVPIFGSASPTVSSNTSASAIGALSNASSFALGENGIYGAGGMTVAAMYASSASGAATGLTSGLSTALTAFQSYMKSQTGTEQAEGVWFPDCPLNLDGDPTQAPKATDLRQSEGPTGIVLGLAGNYKYRHKGLVYSAVPRSQVWESAATYANASWEHFCDTAFFGLGHSWFTPSSRIQIWFDQAGTLTLVGADANDGAGVSGWFVKGITACEPQKTAPPWTGLWRIELPEIVSNG